MSRSRLGGYVQPRSLLRLKILDVFSLLAHKTEHLVFATSATKRATYHDQTPPTARRATKPSQPKNSPSPSTRPQPYCSKLHDHHPSTSITTTTKLPKPKTNAKQQRAAGTRRNEVSPAGAMSYPPQPSKQPHERV